MIHRNTVFESTVNGETKKLTLTTNNSSRGRMLFKELERDRYHWLFSTQVEPQPILAECDILDYQVEGYLIKFAAYLNERCDINVANMVRPFMEGDEDEKR